MDVLIQADRETVEHKLEENVPDGSLPFWSVHGTPQKCGAEDKILFSNGDHVIAEGVIVEVEEDRIWFTSLTEVEKENPEDPPSRGFKYIDTGGENQP